MTVGIWLIKQWISSDNKAVLFFLKLKYLTGEGEWWESKCQYLDLKRKGHTCHITLNFLIRPLFVFWFSFESFEVITVLNMELQHFPSTILCLPSYWTAYGWVCVCTVIILFNFSMQRYVEAQCCIASNDYKGQANRLSSCFFFLYL